MTVSPDVLVGSRLKVERANRHIDELASLSSPLSPDFYEVAVRTRWGKGHLALTNPAPRDYALEYRSLRPVAKTFALIIGDALHNLRSALDHMATGICQTMTFTSQVHFPMRQIRKDLITSNGQPIPDFDMMEAALPGAVHLILDHIRPADGPNERFWAFYVLDNDDKHNLILPTVAVNKITFDASAGGNTWHDSGAYFNADQPAGQGLIVSTSPITMTGQTEATVDVKFGQGTPFTDDRVIPTLTRISAIVSDTIDQFEDLISNS